MESVDENVTTSHPRASKESFGRTAVTNASNEGVDVNGLVNGAAFEEDGSVGFWKRLEPGFYKLKHRVTRNRRFRRSVRFEIPSESPQPVAICLFYCLVHLLTARLLTGDVDADSLVP
jgi:hypothetical protein